MIVNTAVIPVSCGNCGRYLGYSQRANHVQAIHIFSEPRLHLDGSEDIQVRAVTPHSVTVECDCGHAQRWYGVDPSRLQRRRKKRLDSRQRLQEAPTATQGAKTVK